MKGSLFYLILLCLLCTGCASDPSSTNSPMTLANPASVNCAGQGGRLVVEKNAAGSELKVTAYETKTRPEQGTCSLPDGRVCDVHSLYSGICRKTE